MGFFLNWYTGPGWTILVVANNTGENAKMFLGATIYTYQQGCKVNNI